MIRRILALFFALVAAGPAWAAAGALRQQMMQPPGWINHGLRPAVDMDLAGSRFWTTSGQQNPLSLASIARASPETITDCYGNLSYAANNALAVSCAGLQVWEARTNNALYSNDLTQAGTWTATNITVALNATGPDNVASSASTITAGAANATILQAITLSSQADTYSVYVKCVTCTGNIQVAEYPSGTPAFTTLSSSNCFNQAGVGTAPNTTSWVRCQLEATVLNPVVGFNIVNNGDSVQVFCNQLEPGAFQSPCIRTTTVAVTRAADNITAAGTLSTVLLGANLSIVAKANLLNTGSSGTLLEFGGGWRNYFHTTSTARFDDVTTTITATFGSGTTASVTRLAGATNSTTGSLVVNGGTVATGNNTGTERTGAANIGNRAVLDLSINGNLQRLVAWNSRLSNSALQSLSGGAW